MNIAEYWIAEQVAEHYKVKPRTVERWRHRNRGPRFVYGPGRRALYPLSGIAEYDRQLQEQAS